MKNIFGTLLPRKAASGDENENDSL